jgi:hypothetical protein
MDGKVLVDTSVWIEFFRKKNIYWFNLVAGLLREERAVWTGIIILELIRGGKGQKELDVIAEMTGFVDSVEPAPKTYIAAGEKGQALARKGQTFSVVDLLIAQLAMENNLALLSLDRHFKMLSKSFALKRIELK